MDILYSSLCLLVFTVGLAVFSNKTRRTHELPFDLKPNRLLTRWPLLFVTGPRSLFYFSRYWNLYTAFLAEHGYEVFTVHLPWHNLQQRRARFKLFIEQQETAKRRFHLILDQPTFAELKDLIPTSSYAMSVTEVRDKNSAAETESLSAFPLPHADIEFTQEAPAGFFMTLSYGLHRWITGRKNLPTLNTLGAVPQTALANSLVLLERAEVLATMDLRQEDL